jgi:hypothetical protein
MTAAASPAPTFAALDARAAEAGLWALGGFHAGAKDDDLPAGTQTVVLLAPREPGFWARVTAEPEFVDGRGDPLDRWSRRMVGRLACALGGKALFPFAGPPWRPFLSWALRTGRLHPSPVGLLVHDEAGLWVSLRGALALRQRIDLPAPTPSPCETCPDQPCRTGCPVGALGGGHYDIATCRSHVSAPAGADCMTAVCRARRACPASARYPRAPAQSAFHMRAFTGAP